MNQMQLQAACVQTALPDAPFHLSLLPGGAVWTAFHRAGSGIILRFPGLADFTVSPDANCVPSATTRVASLTLVIADPRNIL